MIEKRMALLSLGLLIIGFGGGYALSDDWMGFTLYHIGGLGALGLLACGAGAIARKKGYGFWRGFLFSLPPAIILGLIVAYLVPAAGEEGRPAICGGSISLIVAVVVLLFLAFIKRREEPA